MRESGTINLAMGLNIYEICWPVLAMKCSDRQVNATFECLYMINRDGNFHGNLICNFSIGESPEHLHEYQR